MRKAISEMEMLGFVSTSLITNFETVLVLFIYSFQGPEQQWLLTYTEMRNVRLL